MSAQGTGSDWKETMPLAGWGFLHSWILLVPVTPSVGAVVFLTSNPIHLKDFWSYKQDNSKYQMYRRFVRVRAKLCFRKYTSMM